MIYLLEDVTVQAVVTSDAEGTTAANPTGVRFKVKDPIGTVTTYTLGTDSNVIQTVAGKTYTCTFDAHMAGRWYVRLETLDGSSQVVGVEELTIIVSKSKVV